MKPPTTRSLLVLLLLGLALTAALWLAEAMERREPLLAYQGRNALPADAAPSFSAPGGEYDRSLRLSIRPAHRGAPVIFAAGGAAPTLTLGTVYERPLFLDADIPGVTVVRAREVVDGVAGPLASASYIVGVEHTLPILSIIADPPDLWDRERGILANAWQRGQEWERPVHVTYVEGGGELGFALSAGLRTNRNERFDAPKQSLRLYFRNEYGAARLEYPLFPSHPYQETQSYKRLVLQAGDRSGRWTLLEEQLLADVVADAGGRAPQGCFVLLFVNGESWGVYRSSERIDRFYLQDNLGIQSADLLRNGNIQEGDLESWNTLLDWVATHDLSDTANLAYIETQMDVADFTDYAIHQMYFGFPVKRFSATRPHTAGGRWFWLYGGWRANWTLDDKPDITLLSSPNDAGDLGLLLHGLLQNPDYRARFAGRAADLLNTTLAAPAVQAHLDRLAAQVRPDIGYETTRWSDSADWEQNLTTWRERIQRRPNLLRQQIGMALGLQGTATITFSVSSGEGSVYVSGSRLPASLWSGVYFLSSTVQAIAVPAPGYDFAGWDGGPTTPLITVTVDGPRTLAARFAPTAEDETAVRPNDVIFNEYWINDDGTRYASIGGRPIAGDWLELRVTRPGGVDLRGWRITDNDAKMGTREGSIILPRLEALAAVPRGAVILIVATEDNANAAYFGQDDLDPTDGQMVFYVGNGNLDVGTDPGFGVGRGDDNLVLLSPGPDGLPLTPDDVGIDFVAEGNAVTPFSFSVLRDGVVFEHPFHGLGDDDGAIFIGAANNDDGNVGWVVDSPAEQTNDAGQSLANILTPGAANGQGGLGRQSIAVWLVLAGSVVAVATLCWRDRRNSNLSRSKSD